MRPFIDAINDLMARLDASLRAQQRFVADPAHQMRTSLAGRKTQAELALRQRDGTGAEHEMRQIAVGADRASRLVNQLLALARTDRDALPSVRAEDLVELSREVLRERYPRAVARGIELGFDALAGPCTVRANGALMNELLSNLLENAIRYTPASERMLVRVSYGEAAVLEVEDTGIGIPRAKRELVFERFYRVLGSDTEGSGLGLAMVREIAALHRGSVKLEANSRGRGAVFLVTLPSALSTRPPLRSAA